MDNSAVKVLLVDDDEDDYVLTRDRFSEIQGARFELDWVASYDAALEAIAHNQHDVYLLDYRLGKCSGLELLRQAVANGCKAPMILLTGQGDHEIDVEAMKAGAVDYLEKGHLGAYALERAIRYAIERKRAEQKIREQAALLDVATDAILVRDLDDQILFWNKGAERLYGWKAEESLGKNVYQLLHEDVTQLKDLQQTLTDSGSWQGELHQVTKPGKEIIVESRWTLVRDLEGKPKSILVVNTDITQKKQLEAQFLHAQRLESIGTLAGGIAHDLNNVLTPIIAAAQLLLSTQLNDQKRQRLLMTVETSAKRGAALVKQVLSFARGLEGKRTILQLRHLLLEIKHIAKETFPRAIEFFMDIPSELWVVSGDATQLHQVFMNLCVNARDAMPNGGTLKISAENLLIDQSYAQMHLEVQVGPYIVITVADTGTGIPDEILDRIFEPFFTTKAQGVGTGLGLSTVVGIIKGHSGFVSVNSAVGVGTQFKVYLPAVQGTATPEPADLELPLGHGELVLVVDDEAAIREVTKTSLETYNYRALTASDGIEAVTLYAEHREEISVVLTDMMMPHMDGPTTILTLQKINPQIKIIAVSGLASSDQLPRGAVTGIKTFLSKPYTTQELLKTLDRVLNPNREIGLNPLFVGQIGTFR